MTQVNSGFSTQLLDDAPVGVLITDPKGLVVWCNKTLEGFLGLPAGQLLNRPVDSLDDEVLERADELDAVIVRANGKRHERWLRRYATHVQNGGEQPVSAIFFVDISNEESLRGERDDLAKQLRHQATIEPVSGVLNRRAMLQSLEPLVSRSRRYNNPLSVVSMGVTNYQDIKKQFGENGADQVIQETGQILKDKMRWTDLISRSDPKTFVLILPETDGESAVQLTDKLCKELRQAQTDGNDAPINRVKVSFGVASWTKGDDSNLLLRHADRALEAAAIKGAYRVERFI